MHQDARGPEFLPIQSRPLHLEQRSILHSAGRHCKWRRPGGSETRLHTVGDPQPHALAADVNHGARRGHEIGLSDVVASLFAIDDAMNKGYEFVVRGSAAHQFVEIVVPD